MSNLTENYFPFDTGPGATATPDRWRRMGRQFQWSGIIPGYANQFSATISNGILTINPGAIWVDGFYGETTTAHTVSSSGLGPGLCVLRVDPVAKTIGFYYLPGITTPNQPAQPNVGIYEIPLYYVSSPTAFTDVRQFATATSDWSTTRGLNSNNSNYCARGRMHRDAAYGTSTTLYTYGFDTVDYGASFFSGYTFICPYADDYFVHAQVGFISNASGQWYNMRLCRNGTYTVWAGTNNTVLAGAVIPIAATDIMPCKAGDQITVQHNCSTNGLQGMVGGYSAYFCVRAMSR